MSDELRDKMAEAMCAASAFGKSFPWPTLSETDRDAWREMADAGLVALKASGYEVVKLPEPLPIRVPGGFPRWEMAVETVLLDQTFGEILVAGLTLSRVHARELGAALLAAVNAAGTADGAR